MGEQKSETAEEREARKHVERMTADLDAIKARAGAIRDAINRGDASVQLEGWFAPSQIGLRAVWADDHGRLWRDDGGKMTLIWAPRPPIVASAEILGDLGELRASGDVVFVPSDRGGG